MPRIDTERARRRGTSAPQLEMLEQRQVLSGFTSLLTLPPLTLPSVAPALLGQPPQNAPVATTSGQTPLVTSSSLLSSSGVLSLGDVLSTPTLSSSPGVGKTSTGAVGGALNLDLGVKVAVPALLDLQVSTTLSLGGAKGLGVTADVAVGSTGLTSDILPSLSLSSGVALNTPGSGTSPGAGGNHGGLSLNLNLGGQDEGPPPPGMGGNNRGGSPNGPPSGVLCMQANLLDAPSPPITVPARGLVPFVQTVSPMKEDKGLLAMNWKEDLFTQEQLSEAEDKAVMIVAEPAAGQLPGRPDQASPATPPGGSSSEESGATQEGRGALNSDDVISEDSEESISWLMELGRKLGLSTVGSSAFGPISTFFPLICADTETVQQCIDQLAEYAETDGFAVSCWVLLGLAGVAAYEVANRQCRRDSRRSPWQGSWVEPCLV